MRHRADIDGLRFIAVVPITLVHAGVPALPGGFLGVDVFFVISGFLITSILTRDFAGGTFSLSDFYKKRIVRIFPALFLMLLFVLVAGCMLLLPFELEGLGKAVASAAGFVANIYYWQTLDYFGGVAETNPLLHTWSLGVEEQFYIFYPFLLWLVHRFFSNRLSLVLAMLIVVSAMAGPVMAKIQPEAAFYLLPSRAWQLALGGVVAVWKLPELRRMARESLAWVGMTFILVGYVVIRPDWLLPFPWGLLPSGGAALVIAFAYNTSLHRTLAWMPFRWIGTISYSLYLWHWPIITFYRLWHGRDLSPLDTTGLLAVSVGVAALSYYLVEQPALRRWRDRRPAPIVAGGGVGLAVFVGLGFVISANPFGWRQWSPEIVRISNFANYKTTQYRTRQFREGLCFSTDQSASYDFKTCPRIDSTRRNFALIGDSHAAQYWLALQKRFPEANVIQLTTSGCRVLATATGPTRCQRLIDYTFGPFLQRGHLDKVILSGRWRASDMAGLSHTIRLFRAKNIPVLVIGPIYEFEGDFPLLLARAYASGEPHAVERTRLTTKAAIDALVERTAHSAGAEFYSVQRAECYDGRCAYLGPRGMPLHFDYGHLTEDGAEYVLRDLPPL